MASVSASDLGRVQAVVSDSARLDAVAATGLLDSPPRDSWDGLTSLASRFLQAPMAFITLVDGVRSFYLSCTGLDATVSGSREEPIEDAFCRYVIADGAPIFVSDTSTEQRIAHGATTQRLGVRAWAGYPVLDAEGRALGAFYVMDTAPRSWSPIDAAVLGVLARSASTQVQLLTAVAAERAARDLLQQTRVSERAVEARLQRLAGVALELLSAESVGDLTDVVVNRGLPVLEADGGAVLVREGDNLRLGISSRLGAWTERAGDLISLDYPLPACRVARTGERIHLGTKAEGLADFPAMAEVYQTTKRRAWAFAPLEVGGVLLGSLAVSWVSERDFGDEDLSLIDAFAVQCSQALNRIQVAGAQRAAAQEVQQLAEALQRSLLTQPPTPAELDIAVRYLPAVQEAQIGGDWYDAFNNASGATLVSVGDVTGHDRNAAAGMAQVRNLLRGLAVDSDDSPAILLARLDRAMARLGLDILATALLARVDPGSLDRSRRMRRIRWSSAGHLPPMLRLPTGQVRVLSEDSDLMLGIDPETDRVERITELPDGGTLLLYTDGLIERRGESLDVGVRRLATAFAAAQDDDPEELADRLLEAMVLAAPAVREDDVAILLLRAESRRSRR